MLRYTIVMYEYIRELSCSYNDSSSMRTDPVPVTSSLIERVLLDLEAGPGAFILCVTGRRRGELTTPRHP